MGEWMDDYLDMKDSEGLAATKKGRHDLHSQPDNPQSWFHDDEPESMDDCDKCKKDSK